MQIDLGTPQPKQVLFLKDRHPIVIFGGARGGGKSHVVRMKAVLLCLKHAGIKVCIVRTTYPELQKNHIEPLREMLVPSGVATYNDGRKEMRFRNGSMIYFQYCASDKDITKFSGLQFDVLFVDEATHVREDHLKKMSACVRGVNNFPKRIYWTCNPDGISLSYVRRLIKGEFNEDENPDDFSFIQSLLTDNKILMDADPSYRKKLEALPPKLRQAWLEGDWDVFEGMYFEEFRDKPDVHECIKAGITPEQALRERRWTHVIEPFTPPAHWNIYRSYDWGYGRPFSVGYWALSEENVAYRILEVYGCTKTPNEGVRWSNKQQFDYLRELEDTHPWLKGKRIQGVADPSIWDGSKGISAQEEADKHGIWFEKGINDRIAGWMQVRERLKFDENGYAMMYFFNTCKAIIRTMPLMMYDEHRVEDLNTELEDHACDEVRYFCMMRPIAPRTIEASYSPMIDPLDQFKKQQGVWTAYNNIARR